MRCTGRCAWKARSASRPAPTAIATSPRAAGPSASPPGRACKASRWRRAPRSSRRSRRARSASAPRSPRLPARARARTTRCRARRIGAATACGRTRWNCGWKAMRACTTGHAGRAPSRARAMAPSRPDPGRRRACSPEAAGPTAQRSAGPFVWKTVRVSVLLILLALVAGQQLLERVATQSWKETLWVGIFPLNGDGSAGAQQYIESLTPADFAAIETFFSREARRYGVTLETPVHIELYPQGRTLPPVLARDAGPLGIAWWSLRLRWFAFRHSDSAGQAPARVRIF